MNDDSHELERRLEQATAPPGVDEAPLDPEIARLRAGWLALGELLEAAQPQSSPRPLAAERPWARAAIIATRPSPHTNWLLVVVAALAASLLIAISVTRHILSATPKTTPSALPSQFARDGVKPGHSPQDDGTTAVSDAELAWNSSLDQEIEQAGQAIMQLRQNQLASAAVSDQLQYQLENLRQDIEESPL